MPAKNTPTYLRTHQLRGSVMHFALSAEDAGLRARASASKSGRAAKTLVKEGPLRITLVALTQGTVLGSHEVAGPLSIQSLRGHLRILTDTGDVDVPAGSLAVLDAGVAHSARALEDSAVLISVTMD